MMETAGDWDRCDVADLLRPRMSAEVSPDAVRQLNLALDALR